MYFQVLNYKMYLPFYKKDMIQRYISATNEPYEFDILKNIFTFLESNCNEINNSSLNDKITRKRVVVDIGANVGNHSLFLASKGIEVIAFEANPKLCEIIKENIKINNFEDKITLFNYGLSNKREKANFTKEKPSNYGGMTLKCQSKGTIQCDTLDSFTIQEKIDLIKIDVEGMELAVLQGAEQTILRNKPFIFLESNEVVSFYNIKRFLEKLQYVHQEILGDYGALIHIFVPKEKVNNQILQTNLYKNFSLPLLHSILGNRYFYRKIEQVRNITYAVLAFSLINIIINLVFYILYLQK
ncbi:FkbM family methyltransferase [Campylobacter jejuni]|uniref:FkbM family methyltransferase n=1 Tax=Campylobacter sp. BCW_6465 TaxID=1903582 RepID=UPI00087552A8|nr:FkbM family methyltransferase [Campylobacter sp. BCW_6465]EAJ5474951.1 FkbM family methyltransferase [Campylobacter jejuni]EDP8137470.1 FkbM family methyltransferase [Campylobacter jejuni]OEW44272.1 hypothetical protein AJ886_06130 [Campylobacter sp. BCW_6465]HAA2027466.1 hypothetical protein [Campylobacter jejuni]